MTRELTCIICPRGCSLLVDGESGNLSVTGNSCPKGEKYAIDECTHPVRTVTSTVRVRNRKDVMVSVKTETAVPKESIFAVMKKIREATVCAPVKIGDTVLDNLFGTKVIATKNVE